MASGRVGDSRWNFPSRAIVQAVIDGSAKGTQRLLIEAQIEIKKNLSRSGAGIKHPGLRYTSSAPGQSPAVQTGTLRRSWQTGIIRRYAQGTRTGWRLGSAVRYARRLEFGGGFILPRPYLRPALDMIRPRVEKTMNAYIAQAMRRVIPTAR